MIGSIAEYLYAPDDPEAVIEQMADPATRIVSLTVTEGGYNINPSPASSTPDDPAVTADLEPGRDAEAPRSAWSPRRCAAAASAAPAPFTVMSCDNIQGNGHVARQAFTAFARLRDPELGEWIDREVTFPNSMVDRITPVDHRRRPRAVVAERFGVEDAWPVVCEPFTQWVLEDRFAAGRPPFEDVGVQVVDDVEPYELMKLRLLNASHQALVLLRLPGRLPARARGRPGPAVRRLPAAPTWTARRPRRSRRCPASTSTTTSRR